MKVTAIGVLLLLSIPSLAQKQGICGTVRWIEGNQMPGPGAERSPGKGVAREILVYEVTTMTQVKQENGFYTTVPTRLVARTRSNKKGEYRLKLPPGRYSVFVKETEGLWANLFDGSGAINPVEVQEGDFTVFHIQINYRAAY